jgi:tRNA (cytidine/uridine-2'-O-)-methyltransferase
MLQHHLHVCLYSPEIPQNAGNIGRLCAATQCRLHLTKPFGFTTDDKNLRRAGLDYWPFLDLEIHDSLEDVLNQFQGRFAFFSTKATKCFTEMPVDIDMILFGQETKGLPSWVFEKYSEQAWKIPMYHQSVRSLNVANSASIILYHQLLRRRQFHNLPLLES